MSKYLRKQIKDFSCPIHVGCPSADLQYHVRQTVEDYKTIIAASEALKIDYSYLQGMLRGERANPSAAILKKLGLRKVILFIREHGAPSIEDSREDPDVD